MMNRDTLQDLLSPLGQDHVLQFWDEIGEPEKTELAAQIETLDLAQLSRLIADEDEKPDFAAMAAQATSPPAVLADGSGTDWSIDQARQRGEQALAAGQIRVVLVAGGQGTRLGFDQPKGMFKIGPVSNRTLFQIFADRLLAVNRYYGVEVPLYVMTSDATDAETREYFEQNDYLGLSPSSVKIFKQGTMPAVDAGTGKLLLDSKSSLALSPDGHGGTVSALVRSGSLDDAEKRGVKLLSYIQVDNPLVALCDPVFIGHHLLAGSEMTSQVDRKRYPKEMVANVLLVDGQMQIIEYSDLPDEAAEAINADGSPRFWAGSIAVHVIDIDFLRRMSDRTDALPFHRASKKVPFVAPSGERVEPEAPNATKFERFIFDLLPWAKNAIVVEGLPSECFAPVKNADGAATDTPELARQAIVDLHRGWLERAGAKIAPGMLVEVSPLHSISPEQLAQNIPSNLIIEADRFFGSWLEFIWVSIPFAIRLVSTLTAAAVAISPPKFQPRLSHESNPLDCPRSCSSRRIGWCHCRMPVVSWRCRLGRIQVFLQRHGELFSKRPDHPGSHPRSLRPCCPRTGRNRK